MATSTVGVSVRMDERDYQLIQGLTGKGKVGPFVRMAAIQAAKQIQTTLGTNDNDNH